MDDNSKNPAGDTVDEFLSRYRRIVKHTETVRTFRASEPLGNSKTDKNEDNGRAYASDRTMEIDPRATFNPVTQRQIITKKVSSVPDGNTDFDKKEYHFTSLYRFLEERYNIRIDTSRDFISARTADLAQATTLNIPVGSPLIYVIRISFAEGVPILGDIAYINGYMHHFSFNRSGRSPRIHNDDLSF